MLKDFSLEGKTALVTGGGRGIGRAIALVMAEAGADVAVAARSSEQVSAVASEIEALGRRSSAQVLDVSDSADVDATVQRVIDALGKIDILVNNAGQAAVGPTSPLPEAPKEDPHWHWGYDERMSDDLFHRILETNLGGVLYCCRAVGEHMMRRRSGKVINVASTSAQLAYPFEAAYASSKAAVHMLTKVLALEWGPYSVNVNGISPGWFSTEMTQRVFENPNILDKAKASLPLGRFTDVRDLGLLAVYLASPASDWMTGQVIVLDGGETAIQF